MITVVVWNSFQMTTYNVDPGTLCISETSLVSGEMRSEEELIASATLAARKLFGELLTLPEKAKAGRNAGMYTVVELPVPTMKLPREKAPPKEKPLTAWQKFALKKGISIDKKKKTNRVFNEDKQEWVDKWGKRAREDERKFDWMREVKQNYVPGEEGSDPFLESSREKKATLDKAKKNAEKNKKRAEYQAMASNQVASLDKAVKGLTTASMGKFDKATKKTAKK
jgi:regulator of ribosome biosynthesis